MKVPRYWREADRRYRLEGVKCKECEEKFIGTREVCPNCHSRELDKIQLKKKGKIHSYTVIRSAPEGYEDLTPYIIAIIELKDGLRIMGQITDSKPDEVNIDDEVEFVFRKVKEESSAGLINYGYKFRPVKKPNLD